MAVSRSFLADAWAHLNNEVKVTMLFMFLSASHTIYSIVCLHLDFSYVLVVSVHVSSLERNGQEAPNLLYREYSMAVLSASAYTHHKVSARTQRYVLRSSPVANFRSTIKLQSRHRKWV